MKINEFKINGFGKIKDKQINLEDKINIIYGKNESGKSTILKFLISMLYGSSKNKRGKDISDFERYTPWHLEEFSGKIKYNLDNNEEFEVYREFKKKNPKIFNSKLEDISNEFKNDKTKGIQFFEEQTLIDEETFINTAIIAQEETKLSKSSQTNIIQKIGNQISTGDDNISFKKAIDKITKQQLEQVGTSKTSQKPINIVEQQIIDLEKQKESLEKSYETIYKLEKESEIIKNNIENEENKINLLKEYQAKLDENRLKNAEINFNKNLENEYDEQIEELENKINNKKINKISVLLIIEIILLIITGTIGIMLKNKILMILSIIEIVSLIITIILKRKNKSNNEIKKQIDILNEAKENRIRQVQNKNLKLESEIEAEKQKLIQEYKTKLDISFLETVINMDYNELGVSINNKQKNINDLKVKQSINENEKKNIEEKYEQINSILEKLEELYQEKQELINLNNNFNIVKECLNNAYIKMKDSISPKFQEDLSNTISKISQGKYSNVRFDDDIGLTVEIENGDYISADRLSVGTIDQMYLSLRLSALKEISKENMPIILDEAFAYYDDERLENILNYLINNFENQIIIFTCTQRESQILEKLNIKYNMVKI